MSSNNWLVIPEPGEVDEICGSEARKDLAWEIGSMCQTEKLCKMPTAKLLRLLTTLKGDN